MSAYRTVVVGTDGSESSLRAVDRELQRARDVLGDDGYQVLGSTTAEETVRGAAGLNSIKGRLLGSVPADATRRSTVDVLVVHTTD